MSKKNYKYNKEVRWTIEDAMKFFQKPKGRIKRMRNPIPKHRCPALSKRIGCYRTFLITTLPTEIFSKALFGITRWNRH